MTATITLILTLASQIVADAPEILAIVETAIAAFRANDQASLDAAHAQAIALADSLKPDQP